MTATSDAGDAAPEPALTRRRRLPDRVHCEHAERCGGCPLIGLSYGDQLALKRGRVVQSVLARYASLELVYTEPVAPAEPFDRYRTRAKLVVSQGAQMGLFGKGGGHQVVDIPGLQASSRPRSLAAADALRLALIVAAESSGGPSARRTTRRSLSTRRGAARSGQWTSARCSRATQPGCW